MWLNILKTFLACVMLLMQNKSWLIITKKDELLSPTSRNSGNLTELQQIITEWQNGNINR